MAAPRNTAAANKRLRKRKRRTQLDDSSSSSSSSESSSSEESENEEEKEEKGKKVEKLASEKSSSDSDSDSDSSVSSSSSDSSSGSSSAPSIRVKGKKKTQHSVTQQQQRQSLSPQPSTANDAFIPTSIFNDSGASLSLDGDKKTENPIRTAFRSHWMATIADSFSGDLEKLSTEPHMNGDKLKLLIGALSTNNTAIQDDEVDLVLSETKNRDQDQDVKMEE